MKLHFVNSKRPVNARDIAFIGDKSYMIIGVISPRENLKDGGVIVQTMCERKYTCAKKPQEIGAHWIDTAHVAHDTPLPNQPCDTQSAHSSHNHEGNPK